MTQPEKYFSYSFLLLYFQCHHSSSDRYHLFLYCFSNLFYRFPTFLVSVYPNFSPFPSPCLCTCHSFPSLDHPSSEAQPKGHLLWLSSVDSHRALGLVPSEPWSDTAAVDGSVSLGGQGLCIPQLPIPDAWWSACLHTVTHTVHLY